MADAVFFDDHSVSYSHFLREMSDRIKQMMQQSNGYLDEVWKGIESFLYSAWSELKTDAWNKARADKGKRLEDLLSHKWRKLEYFMNGESREDLVRVLGEDRFADILSTKDEIRIMIANQSLVPDAKQIRLADEDVLMAISEKGGISWKRPRVKQTMPMIKYMPR